MIDRSGDETDSCIFRQRGQVLGLELHQYSLDCSQPDDSVEGASRTTRPRRRLTSPRRCRTTRSRDPMGSHRDDRAGSPRLLLLAAALAAGVVVFGVAVGTGTLRLGDSGDSPPPAEK